MSGEGTQSSGLPWTTFEDAAIREYYPEHGHLWDGWARHTRGRSPDAVLARASRLGVRKRVEPAWTRDEELAMLRHLMRMARSVGKTPSACVAHLYAMRREVIAAQVAAGMPRRVHGGGRR